MGKTRNTANISADNILSVDISNNRIGINSTTPGYTLDVTGDINFSGNLYQAGAEFSSGVGIATAGGTLGVGVTLLDFRGSGISTVTFSSGIATINIEGGGGSSTPDISPVMMSMIF